jgi:hypothetical protein
MRLQVRGAKREPVLGAVTAATGLCGLMLKPRGAAIDWSALKAGMRKGGRYHVETC